MAVGDGVQVVYAEAIREDVTLGALLALQAKVSAEAVGGQRTANCLEDGEAGYAASAQAEVVVAYAIRDVDKAFSVGKGEIANTLLAKPKIVGLSTIRRQSYASSLVSVPVESINTDGACPRRPKYPAIFDGPLADPSNQGKPSITLRTPPKHIQPPTIIGEPTPSISKIIPLLTRQALPSKPILSTVRYGHNTISIRNREVNYTLYAIWPNIQAAVAWWLVENANSTAVQDEPCVALLAASGGGRSGAVRGVLDAAVVD